MLTVSVIIPTYNRSQLLQRAINSVFNQTIKKDVEIIVIDDGSTDNTKEVIAQFNNPNLIYIIHDKNKGVVAARNTGLSYAKAEYIAFLDSDDFWDATKLEKQLQLFVQGSEKLGLVYTDAQRDYQAGIKYRGDIHEKVFTQNAIVTSSVLVKKCCFDKVGYFDESIPCGEDWDMWIRISQFYEVDFVNVSLVSYDQQVDSISVNSQVWLTGHRILENKYSNNIKKLPKNLRAEHYLYLAKSCRKKSFSQALLYCVKALFYQPLLLMDIFRLARKKLYMMWLH
ncbi:MAG: hypothetical protein RIQ94_116 [Pseudomonadota bacterium]|jgi:glycosyltransferase involved in cell wall biosynthesis